MTRRTDRLDLLIRQELAEVILREVADPRVRRAVVSEVHVTPNLSLARVAVSIVGEEAERAEVLAALGRARGFLRRELARRLRLRVIPELEFSLDRGAEHSVRIAQLLEDLHDDDHDPTA